MADKHPGGRPTTYTAEIVARVKEYLELTQDTSEVIGENRPVVVQNVNLPTIEGLAYYLGIHKDTIYEWEKIHQEFSDVITRVRNAQAERLINKGLSGAYNPQIAKVLLTKHGYVDKQEVDSTIKGDVTFINDMPRPKSVQE